MSNVVLLGWRNKGRTPAPSVEVNELEAMLSQNEHLSPIATPQHNKVQYLLIHWKDRFLKVLQSNWLFLTWMLFAHTV